MTDARNALDLEICANLHIEKRSLNLKFELYVTRAAVLVKTRIIWNADINAKVFLQKKDNNKEYKELNLNLTPTQLVGNSFFFLIWDKYLGTGTHTRVYLLNAFLCIIKFKIMSVPSTQKTPPTCRRRIK